MDTNTAVMLPGERLPEGLANAVLAWSDARTDPNSQRRHDLLRDKRRALALFFEWTGKPIDQVTEIDVKTWQAELESQGLAPATVYAMISRLSSFYTWAMSDPDLKERIRRNPARMARPKAPKPYQTEAAKALEDDQVKALLEVVKARAETGDLVGKRDYSLLLFYLATGMRRREVIGLRWGDLRIGETLTLTGQVKGGDYVGRAVDDPRVKTALVDYLQASGRWANLNAGDPLWTSHDRANVKPGAALSSHAFTKNLKAYGQQAGIGDIHLHQTRHTFARIVGEDTGSMIETQDALGHKNLVTTKVYLQRVTVKRDKYSRAILDRLGV